MSFWFDNDLDDGYVPKPQERPANPIALGRALLCMGVALAVGFLAILGVIRIVSLFFGGAR